MRSIYPSSVGLLFLLMSSIRAFIQPSHFYFSSANRYQSRIKTLAHIESEDMFDKKEESFSPNIVSDDELEVVMRKPVQVKPMLTLASVLHVENEPRRKTTQRTRVVAHRGSNYQFPENTVRAFVESYEAGCDGIELDVFLLKCGTLVVFHGTGGDENPGKLEKYCNVPGSILDYTAIEAREQLRLNPVFREFGCPIETIIDEKIAYIPTLEEVLRTLKGNNMDIKIELKGAGTTVPVLELVESLNMVDQVHYSSFNHERIALLRKLRPQLNPDGTHVYKTGALFTGKVPKNFVEIAQEAGASEVHLKYDTCTKERVEQIHAGGMNSMCWFRGRIGMLDDVTKKYGDVEDEDSNMYEIVMRTGVGAMCVNKPEVLVDLIEQMQSDEIMSMDCEDPDSLDVMPVRKVSL